MAYKALGTRFYLYVWNDSMEMYDEYEIKGIKEISGVSLGTYSTIDVTTLDTDSDFKTYIVGLADGAEIELTGLWNPDGTNQDKLKESVNNPEKGYYLMITFPDGSAFTANILPLNFEVTDTTVEGVLSFSWSAKIVGKPLFSVP